METDAIKESISQMRNWQQTHEVRDTLQFNKIHATLARIESNHLQHIQDATAETAAATTATDKKVDEILIQMENWWLKKILFSLFWMVGLIIVGVMIAWITKMI